MSHIPMTAPAPTSQFGPKEKHPSWTPVPMGMQPAVIISMVNTGTHDDQFKDQAPRKRNKLVITYEFPLHTILQNKEDTIPEPSVLSQTYTYSVSKSKKSGKKSGLLELIEGLFGPIAESQYLSWDLSNLLGMKVLPTVQHYQKEDGSIGAKITSVAPINPAFFNPANLVAKNPLVIYNVKMGFDNAYFAQLKYWQRADLKESDEGKEWAKQGGKFAKYDENNNLVLEDGAVAAQVQVQGGGVTMINPAHDYNSFKAQGWTDDMLVANGYATFNPAPAPAPLPPVPVAPAAPSAPVAPAIPAAAPVAAVSATVGSGIVMIDTVTPYEAYTANGWNDELLILHGKAYRPAPAAAPVAPPIPSAPPAPAAPIAPPAPAAPVLPVAPVVPQAPAIPAQPVYAQPVAPAAPVAPPVYQHPATPVAPAPPQDPANLFAATAAAPVAQVAPPAPAMPQMPQMPQAPPQAPTGFQAAPPAPFAASDEDHDDLPF